jgi:hypothetical protein
MTIEGEFRRHLPATVAEPAARIEADIPHDRSDFHE